jgi:hypothetical protein
LFPHSTFNRINTKIFETVSTQIARVCTSRTRAVV